MLDRIKRMFGTKGFTLIELLTVVAVVLILTSIAIIQFKNYHEKTVNAAALDDLRNVKTAVESFYGDQQEYP
jgi:prepilin-type N-terminal cleavage/methylation domain-containing protein